MEPSDPSGLFKTEDILKTLRKQGHEIAMVLLPGIQYYTGQLFDIPKITKVAQDMGCVVGWDLAHAAGNVKLSLHEWNVDFAAWCSYKVLHSLIREVLIQSCPAGAKNFTNYVFCHVQFNSPGQSFKNHCAIKAK